MTPEQTPLEVAQLFVQRINSQDLDGLANLMSAGHRFIDSLGAEFVGREVMKEGWRQYFRMVPDYTIEVSESFSEGPVVVMLGVAGGTYSTDGTLDPGYAWRTPGAWRAHVIDGEVVGWQVYADNEAIRRCMRERMKDEG